MRPRCIKVADMISVVFLLGLSLVVLVARGRLPEASRVVATYAVLLLLQIGVILGRGRGIPPLLTAFFPLIPILTIYASLSYIPALNPTDGDQFLISVDRGLFGVDPSLWLEPLITPWLTEVMQLSYLVYYALPFLLLGALYRRRPGPSDLLQESGPAGEAFDLCLVALLLSHYLAFIGYLMVPALGPRYALASSYRTELAGLLLATPIADLLNSMEGIKRDAFPSGHTSAALICLYYTTVFTPRLVRVALPGVTLMILATVYLRYHYVADILAGAILAMVCLLLAPRLLRLQRPAPASSP
jgi:membrane-associated phospholipid phosphatase